MRRSQRRQWTFLHDSGPTRRRTKITFVRCFVWLLLSHSLLAQPPVEEPVERGPDVSPPRMTNLANSQGIEGSVILPVVVSSAGRIVKTETLRPAGYGFGPEARKSVEKWRFTPARKANCPVAYAAIIEIKFELPSHPAAIRRRELLAKYNRAVTGIRNPDPAVSSKAREELLALSKSEFAAAQFTEGMFRLHGQAFPVDKEAGLAKILAAAKQQLPAAVGQVGIYHYEGRNLPLDKEKGMSMIRVAALQDSFVAQLYPGELLRSEKPAEAATYYRRCAAVRQSTCQTRLAEYLFEGPREKWPEAIACLELAAAQNHPPARALLDRHQNLLTAEEVFRATELRKGLAKP